MTHAARLRAAVRRLTEALHAGIPASDVLQSVVEEARRLTDAVSAALCLLTDSRDMLDFVAAAGENADDILGLRIRVADSLSETVVETGQPFLLDQRSSAPTGPPPPPRSGSPRKFLFRILPPRSIRRQTRRHARRAQ